MSRRVDDTTAHPVLRFLDQLETALDDIAHAPTWSLAPTETTAAITRLAADLARIAEVESRLLHHADTLDLPGTGGFRSTTAWFAKLTRLTHSEAARKVRLSTALAEHQATRSAVGRGEVHPEQALAITRAVDDLTDGEHARHAESAEQHLIGQAADFDAHDLTRIGRRIVEVIDPDRADAHEAALLEKQEARARKHTTFRMTDDGEGLTRGTFAMPTAQASMLRKALHGLAAPKHVRATDGPGTYDHHKPTPDRLGAAFLEYVERYPTHALPTFGGLTATVIVTTDAATLTGTAKAAHLDTGTAISPGQLTRWACEARLIPAVLDTGGHVLDLGRSTRLHTGPQRTALIIEQHTCQHPTCTTPGAFCHVHHTTPWKDGGGTNTHDAVLLCPFHHHQAHTQGIDYPIRT